MKYVFLTGVPGSRWGRLEWIVRDNSPIVDQSSWLQHNQDRPENGTEHYHRFYGPYHNYGEMFDVMHLIGPDAVMREIERSYSKPQPKHKIRFVRCHWFAYQLDWIKENLPEVDILMMMREPQQSLDWWLESGGWDIQYPNYQWYNNSHNMRRQIMIENACMEKFIRENDLKMNYPVAETPQWIKANWPELLKHLPNNHTYHEYLIKPSDHTLFPVLYRGKKSCSI